MGEFVKKTLVGYKEVPGGHSDPECSHVILTLEEYERQLQRIADAEQETRSIKHEAEKRCGGCGVMRSIKFRLRKHRRRKR